VLETLSEIGNVWVGTFIFDFSRYMIGVGSVFLVVWILFKRQLQGRKIRKKIPKAEQMWREFKHSVITVGVYGLVGMLTYFGSRAGYIEFYSDPAKYGWLYWGYSLLVVIIAHDAYFYWAHRAMHLPGAMKYIHGLHHKSFNPTPWAAYSFDVFEAAVQAAFVPLFLLFMPMHSGVMFIFLGHMILRNAMGHSGYELFPRRWAAHPIFGAITLVTHHDLHHANGQYNFGLYFSWWDRMMGTEHPDYLARVTGDPETRRRRLLYSNTK